MQSTLKDTKELILSLALCLTVVISLPRLASATEHGATAFPVGVETVMTGMYPRPGQTWFYEYTAFYEANQIDNAQGNSAQPEFKLRIFATAIKLNRTWGFKLLGGNFNTNVAIPEVYEQLHVAPGKFEKYAVQNVDWVPLGLVYNKGFAHWYYEADIFTPGTAYSKNDVVNIGTHYFSVGPVFGITMLPNKGKTEISSRTTYLFNGPDKDTYYHSGNEYFTEFNVDQSFSKKVALGVNGYIYKQTTDDKQNLAVYEGGYRGRDLQIGPQVRIGCGHGAFALKYYRDTLVQNRTRGNQFWFQIGVPFTGLSRKSKDL